MRTFARWGLWCLGMVCIGIVVCAGIYVSVVVVLSEHRHAARERYDRELYRQQTVTYYQD